MYANYRNARLLVEKEDVCPYAEDEAKAKGLPWTSCDSFKKSRRTLGGFHLDQPLNSEMCAHAKSLSNTP